MWDEQKVLYWAENLIPEDCCMHCKKYYLDEILLLFYLVSAQYYWICTVC